MIQSHPVVLSIRAVRVGRGRAPLGDLLCPFPPVTTLMLSVTTPPHTRGLFLPDTVTPHCWGLGYKLNLSHTHTHPLALVLGWHWQELLWDQADFTAWTWSRICCKLTRLTHTHTEKHTYTLVENKHTSKACFTWPWRILQPRRTRTLILSYLSRWGVLCVCVCVSIGSVCAHHKLTLDQFSSHL